MTTLIFLDYVILICLGFSLGLSFATLVISFLPLPPKRKPVRVRVEKSFSDRLTD